MPDSNRFRRFTGLATSLFLSFWERIRFCRREAYNLDMQSESSNNLLFLFYFRRFFSSLRLILLMSGPYNRTDRLRCSGYFDLWIT